MTQIKLATVNDNKIKKSRMKIFLYGEFGCGKTYATCEFPNAYFFDTEDSVSIEEYYNLLVKNNSAPVITTDIDDIINHINVLMTTRHNFKTIIIDSMTTIYSTLIARCAAFGTEYGKHHEMAKRKMSHLISLLINVDMNVIVTSKCKEYHEEGDNKSTKIVTFDCYKDFPYMMNMVLFMQKRGEKRIAMVKKSRHSQFHQDMVFDFNYENLSTLFGVEVAEKESIPEAMSTPKQIIEIKQLINMDKNSNELVAKWLQKANATSFEEMSHDALEKCIVYMKSKINNQYQQQLQG